MLLHIVRLGNDSTLLVTQSNLFFSQPFERLAALVQDIVQALTVLVGDNSLEITMQLLEMLSLAFSQLLFECFLPALSR